MKDKQLQLNPEQQLVVQHTQASPQKHMVVVAGPGTGKTEVLILRAQALLQAGINPSSIACISFTNASAKEMLSRLTQRTHVTTHILEAKWHVHTFHSFFLHLLKSQVHATPFRFVSPSIWYHHFSKILFSTIIRHRPLTPIAKNDLSTLAVQIIESHHEWLYNPPKDPLLEWICHTFRQYYENTPCPIVSVRDVECFFWIKQRQGVLPFFPYTHLLIDEFQDTSKIQYNIIMTTLKQSAATLFAVGDAKQSIYGFRKAHVENFWAIQEEVKNNDGVVIHLTTNYRSELHILEQANKFQHTFLKEFPDPPLTSNTPSHPHHYSPSLISCKPDTLIPSLTQRCEVAAQNHTELAILFRTKEDLRTLKKNLPPHIQPLLQTSEDHQMLLMSSPFARGLAFGYLSSLFPDQEIYHHAWKTSHWHPRALPTTCSLNTQHTLHHLLSLATSRPSMKIGVEMGEIKEIQAVHAFMQVLTEAAQILLPDFPYQLENYILSLLDPMSQNPATFPFTSLRQRQKLIHLSTLHGAKGLEFDHVVLVINKHSLPRIQSYPYILEHAGVWGYRYRTSGASAAFETHGEYDTLQKDFKARCLAEEFRLLYVALTRAKKHLEIFYVEEEVPRALASWVKNDRHDDGKALASEISGWGHSS